MGHSQYQGKSYVICSSFTHPECFRRGHLEACLVHEMLSVLFPPWGVQDRGFREHFLYLEVVTIQLSHTVPLFLFFSLLVTP